MKLLYSSPDVQGRGMCNYNTHKIYERICTVARNTQFVLVVVVVAVFSIRLIRFCTIAALLLICMSRPGKNEGEVLLEI